MVADVHRAEDVTQGTFVALAQNARQLIPHPVLSGWLHRTARNLAANAVRSEARRQSHEQQAVAMNELLSAETDAPWDRIAPHLDAALGELNESERDILLLRYFQKESALEIGRRLGISADAAQKRVSRAVERLRESFAKRGIAVGASGLAVVLSANAVQAAPVGLTIVVSGAASVAGAAVITSATSTAVNGMAMTTLQKTVFAAMIVAVGAGVYQTYRVSALKSQLRTNGYMTERVQQMASDRDDALRRLASVPNDMELNSLRSDRAELLRLRATVNRLLTERAELERRSLQQTNAMRAAADPKPAFEHRFLSRSTWTNAGLATPMAALETFLWAWTSKDEASLSQVSVSDSNGLPVGLAGMSHDFRDKLLGAQALSYRFISGEHPAVVADIVTEYRSRGTDANGQPFEGTNHGILRLQFEKRSGVWRFAGKDRWPN